MLIYAKAGPTIISMVGVINFLFFKTPDITVLRFNHTMKVITIEEQL